MTAKRPRRQEQIPTPSMHSPFISVKTSPCRFPEPREVNKTLV